MREPFFNLPDIITLIREKKQKIYFYHEWKCNANALVHLNDEQHSQAQDLNDCKNVNFEGAHMTQEYVVGLMLLGHENQYDSMHELNAVQGRYTHV
jgi:hypothetical protein